MLALLDRDRVSTSEAVRIAGVSAETVRAWMRAGRLTFEARPFGALIDRAALGRLIAEREAANRERR